MHIMVNSLVERLYRHLIQDEDFRNYAKSKFNNIDCRIMGLGEKVVRKDRKTKIKQMSLGDF